MKILVLGGSGMLGASLVPSLSAQGHQVITASRGNGGGLEVDLGDAADMLRLAQAVSPEVIINLVGMTDVERCELHPKEAWLTNVRIVENIAAATSAVDTHLVHISTDQVYDGTSACVEQQASPGNHYAMTKYAGELAAMATRATVLRTNFFGASRHTTRRSLTDWLFSALTENRPVQVFEDVHFSPLCMATLCEMMEVVVEQRPTGVFNLGSQGCMTKADFAFAFARSLGLSERLLIRSTTQQVDFLKAWRPKNMCMDSTRFEKALNITLPTLETEIQRAVKDYRELI